MGQAQPSTPSGIVSMAWTGMEEAKGRMGADLLLHGGRSAVAWEEGKGHMGGGQGLHGGGQGAHGGRSMVAWGRSRFARGENQA